MFKIIIATHGQMSTGIKDAVSTIVGMDGGIKTFNLISGKSVDELGVEILEELKTEPQDTLIFTDLLSASPYNQSLLAINQIEEEARQGVYIVGGVSLPMVLEAINHNLLDNKLSEVIEGILNQGKENMGIWHTSLLEDAEEDADDDF